MNRHICEHCGEAIPVVTPRAKSEFHKATCVMRNATGTARMRRFSDVTVTFKHGRDALGDMVTVIHRDGLEVSMSLSEFTADFEVVGAFGPA